MKFKIVPLEQGRLKEQRLIKGTKTAAHRLREGASGQRIVLAIVSSRVWILLSFKQGTKLSVGERERRRLGRTCLSRCYLKPRFL